LSFYTIGVQFITQEYRQNKGIDGSETSLSIT
jgi:hypothetical protein